MRRRFLLLSAVLVALNLALWLAPQGLALRKVLVSQLFGPRLVRAEVIVRGGNSTSDWRVDRGVITAASLSQLTLREADGKLQSIQLTSATHVIGPGRPLSIGSLARGWRVLVTWPANGAADLVKVEKRSSGSGNGRGHGNSHN